MLKTPHPVNMKNQALRLASATLHLLQSVSVFRSDRQNTLLKGCLALVSSIMACGVLDEDQWDPAGAGQSGAAHARAQPKGAGMRARLHGAGGPGKHPPVPGVPARAHGGGANLGGSQTPAIINPLFEEFHTTASAAV